MHDAVRVRQRQSAEEHAVEKAEERCVYAERERQAEHRRESISGITANAAERATEVGADAGERAAIERDAYGETAQHLTPVPEPAASAGVECLSQIAGDGIGIAPADEASQNRFG
ncbi:MAG: hypothetical protein WDO73_13090 [Ignavibacteriota bacterium]